MTYQLSVLAMHVLEVMFFAGMLGCTASVIFSWLSVGKGSFSSDEDED